MYLSVTEKTALTQQAKLLPSRNSMLVEKTGNKLPKIMSNGVKS